MSKVIIEPEKVPLPCLHTMFHQDECCLPEDLALMYHYRLWTNINFTGVPIVDNRRMYDFADKLANNIAKVYHGVQKNR